MRSLGEPFGGFGVLWLAGLQQLRFGRGAEVAVGIADALRDGCGDLSRPRAHVRASYPLERL